MLKRPSIVEKRNARLANTNNAGWAFHHLKEKRVCYAEVQGVECAR